MSLGICIPDLIEQGKLTGARAKRAETIYQQLLDQYDHQMGDEAAKARATGETVAMLTHELELKKRRTALQAARQAEILENSLNIYGDADGGIVSGKALLAHLVRDEQGNGISNVEYRWRAVKGQALGKLYDILAKHRANLAGVIRNKSDLTDMVRAAAGETVDSVNAREMADAWSQTAEWLRLRANAAGADIGKLEGWTVPHHHNDLAVGAVAPERWIDDVMAGLDRDRMIDLNAGNGLPFTDEKLRAMLAGVYETIVSGGWNKRAAGGMGEGAMAGRHDHHRVLHFRDADSWLAYHEKYGSGTIYDTMMGHVETMSRDIAAMEILGPNPAATIKWMQDMAEKDAAMKGSLDDRAKAQIDGYTIGKVWAEITGENRRQVNRNLALIGSTARNLQTSTKLGSAVISSMSDHGTSALTRQFNGLPVMGHLADYLKMLNPLDRSDAEFVRRAGVISDEFIGRMSAAGRMHVEDDLGGRLSMQKGRRLESVNELSRRVADGILRASGLSAHTVAVREAMGMEFLAAPRTYADKAWDDLPPPWRGFLERSGMTGGDWDNIRAAPPVQHKGADFLDLDALPADVRDKYQEGMLREIDFAVPSGGLYTRALVNVAQPGTIAGELIRTGFQFKMFPVTVVAMHGGRAWHMPSMQKTVGYTVAFLAATTVMGALSLQLSELAKGKNPAPMGADGFIWKSALKGGGLGVMGDFINLNQNQFGQKPSDILAGPTWSSLQTLNTVRRAAWDSITVDMNDPEAVEKAAKLRGRAMRELLVREVPGGSLWYARLAYERAVVDQMAMWASDGAFEDSFGRQEKRAAKEGQSYWFKPGGGLDDVTAPKFEEAFGTASE